MNPLERNAAAIEPISSDLIDHPAIRRMSLRELADLPFPLHQAACGGQPNDTTPVSGASTSLRWPEYPGALDMPGAAGQNPARRVMQAFLGFVRYPAAGQPPRHRETCC